MIRQSYKATIFASCMGYFIQAILINYTPLLFITFEKEFGLNLASLSILISANFITEFLIDFVASRFVSKIGYRKCIVFADTVSAFGLIALPLLPEIMSNKFVALIIASILCGLGGGFIEVLISPIVEACPTKKKSAFMSMLHSFYSWGQMLVIIISTVFFLSFGIENWRYLCFIWAVIPIINLILFLFVPINALPEDENFCKLSSIVKNKMFLLFLVMMLCAGATEQTMSQWASAFVEAGLGIEKWIGDLLGPCIFAFCMGCARVFYAAKSEKIKLEKAILISSLICISSYLIAVFSPFSIMSLFGCALCGLGCGLLWPGTYSLATKRTPLGGVSMFGFLALFGDIGCFTGPTLAGQVSNAFSGNMKAGFAVSLIYPVLLFIIVLIMIKTKSKKE